jgi:hypothetical protein
MEKCHFFDPETELCVTVPFYVRPVKEEASEEEVVEE